MLKLEIMFLFTTIDVTFLCRFSLNGWFEIEEFRVFLTDELVEFLFDCEDEEGNLKRPEEEVSDLIGGYKTLFNIRL